MTMFLNCELSEVVRPEGWHNWGNPEREQTARYAEHANTGNGADTKRRVTWARQLSPQEAAALSAEKVLAGEDHWRP
jgi:pectinesterase